MWTGIAGLLNPCSVFKLSYTGAYLNATQLNQARRFLCSRGQCQGPAAIPKA